MGEEDSEVGMPVFLRGFSIKRRQRRVTIKMAWNGVLRIDYHNRGKYREKIWQRGRIEGYRGNA